jgi:hypothetical protein
MLSRTRNRALGVNSPRGAHDLMSAMSDSVTDGGNEAFELAMPILLEPQCGEWGLLTCAWRHSLEQNRESDQVPIWSMSPWTKLLREASY